MMRIILNNKDIVIPIFNALDLNSELSRDLVREASATALSADNNNSRTGIILAVIENEGIIISTKTYPIILLEAKLEGKNISSKKQLIQQLKPIAGEYLSD